MIPILYHHNDPTCPMVKVYSHGRGGRLCHGHVWHYVYLHAAAERLNDLRAKQNGWEWAAPDLFVSDQPMPEEDGEYPVILYGKLAIAVISNRQLNRLRGGRIALLKDKVGLRHAMNVEEWR